MLLKIEIKKVEIFKKKLKNGHKINKTKSVSSNSFGNKISSSPSSVYPLINKSKVSICSQSLR